MAMPLSNSAFGYKLYKTTKREIKWNWCYLSFVLLLAFSHPDFQSVLHKFFCTQQYRHIHTDTHTQLLLKFLEGGQNRTEGRPSFDKKHIRAFSYWWSWKELQIKVKGLRVQPFKGVSGRPESRLRHWKQDRHKGLEIGPQTKKKKLRCMSKLRL